jgi:hypothetical protein
MRAQVIPQLVTFAKGTLVGAVQPLTRIFIKVKSNVRRGQVLNEVTCCGECAIAAIPLAADLGIVNEVGEIHVQLEIRYTNCTEWRN